jgi:hypothetical protein
MCRPVQAKTVTGHGFGLADIRLTPAGFRRRLAAMTQLGFIQKRCNISGRTAITLIPPNATQTPKAAAK